MSTTPKAQPGQQPSKTWLDLVREYFPDAPEDLADYILWNETAFPCCGADHIALQLARLKCREEFLCGGPFWTFEQEMEMAVMAFRDAEGGA